MAAFPATCLAGARQSLRPSYPCATRGGLALSVSAIARSVNAPFHRRSNLPVISAELSSIEGVRRAPMSPSAPRTRPPLTTISSRGRNSGLSPRRGRQPGGSSQAGHNDDVASRIMAECYSRFRPLAPAGPQRPTLPGVRIAALGHEQRQSLLLGQPAHGGRQTSPARRPAADEAPPWCASSPMRSAKGRGTPWAEPVLQPLVGRDGVPLTPESSARRNAVGRIDHFADAACELVESERLLQQIDPCVEPPVVHDGIPRIARCK